MGCVQGVWGLCRVCAGGVCAGGMFKGVQGVLIFGV